MSDISTGAEDTQAVETATDRTSPEATANNGGKEQGSGSQAQTTNQTNNNTNNQQADPQIKELRREAANYRTQLNEAKTGLEAATAKVSQIEAERDALRNELREIKVGSTIREVVSMAQPVHMEPVMALLGNDFKVDGRTGEVDKDAIGARLTEIQTKFPTLFRGANLGGDAGAGGGNASGVDMNRALRQAVGYS